MSKKANNLHEFYVNEHIRLKLEDEQVPSFIISLSGLYCLQNRALRPKWRLRVPRF